MTVIEILTSTEKKSDGRSTSEQRLYVSSLDSSAERLSKITKQHWAIESMHWDLDRNLRQDNIKRKAERAARNLDAKLGGQGDIQRGERWDAAIQNYKIRGDTFEICEKLLN